MIGFFSQIRMRYDPRLRIYLIQDNLSCHWTPRCASGQPGRTLELVPTPTYASFLNRIECHFWALGEFVVKNADYDWDELARRWPATSPTATAPTATAASSRPNAASGSRLTMGYGWKRFWEAH